MRPSGGRIVEQRSLYETAWKPSTQLMEKNSWRKCDANIQAKIWALKTLLYMTNVPDTASSTPVYCRDKMRGCVACMTVECGTVETGLPANRPMLRLKATVLGKHTLQAAAFFPSKHRPGSRSP